MEDLGAIDSRLSTCTGDVVKSSDNKVEESENPGDKILDEFELYFDDISDRLTISRMVSDSIIKGMISAVEQEAAEKVARKDLEFSRLKETMQPYHVGSNENGSVKCSGASFTSKDYSDALIEHDRVQESMGHLKIAAKEQFKRLKKEIDRIRRKGSGSELVGLGGILEEKMPDKWVDVDRTIDALRTSLDSVYKQVDNMVRLSRLSLIEWEQEREIQTEVEGMVTKNCIWGFQEDFEQKWWCQNAKTYGNESANQLHKIKEISSVRQELEAISRSLSASESGQLISHGSLEHRKALANHVSSTSLWDGNGKHDESIIDMPENFDLSTLKDMDKDELASYFKNEMTKMKRQHESKVQEVTEKYFSLKRKYLKDIRKKIPEVISKLDSVLVETEKSPTLLNNAESIANLKERLESLHSENYHLRDFLVVKKKELRSLSMQVSDAAVKMSEHSLTEANLLEKNLKLQSALEDAHFEASLSADLYRFLVKELLGQIECSQESHMEQAISQAIYEIICREIACNSDSISKVEIEDSEMESIIMQGICGDIFKEAFKEAEGKPSDVNMKYINENDIRLSLEMEKLEKEKELSNKIAEKEKLTQQILTLTESINEKVELLQEGEDALRREKKKSELAYQELFSLRVQTLQQQSSISKSNEELQVVKNNLVKAFEEIELQKSEISELRKRLELTTESLNETTEEKRELLNVSQERQNALFLFAAREVEYKKQMESVILLLYGLSETLTNFECRAMADIKTLSLRLENLSSEFSWVIQKVNRLKRTGLLYKQRLERSCADLQKAEAEDPTMNRSEDKTSREYAYSKDSSLKDSSKRGTKFLNESVGLASATEMMSKDIATPTGPLRPISSSAAQDAFYRRSKLDSNLQKEFYDPLASLDLAFLEPPADSFSATKGLTPEALEATKMTLARVLNMDIVMVDSPHCQDALDAIKTLQPLCTTPDQKEKLALLQRSIPQVHTSFIKSIESMSLDQSIVETFKKDIEQHRQGSSLREKLTTDIITCATRYDSHQETISHHKQEIVRLQAEIASLEAQAQEDLAIGEALVTKRDLLDVARAEEGKRLATHAPEVKASRKRIGVAELDIIKCQGHWKELAQIDLSDLQLP